MTKFRISKKSEEFAYRIPKTAQQTIPIRRIHKDGIWEVGNKFSRTWRFSDINFAVADDEDKRSILMLYCALEKALPTDAITKISVSNRRLNPDEFQNELLMQAKEDDKNDYRREYNRMMMDKAAEGRTSFKTVP